MALQGNLRDMSVADLIQQYGQDQKTAELSITHDNQQANLFFKGGTVAHAVLGNTQGEEVIYRILQWETGEFSLETGIEPPTVTIQRSWSGLLLEGARRLDEESYTKETEEIVVKETQPMATKRKSDLLAEILADLLRDSADIVGAGVVGTDGLVYSANVPFKDMEEDMVGAAAAAAFGLSKRSATQLKRGNFSRTLIQGDEGNIIIVNLNPETLLVALTPDAVNLGMAFAEVRDAASQLQDIL
jgi:uncharacterized protein